MRSRKPSPPREAFISHSARDRKFVKKLAQALRGQGIRCWYSEAHIRGAQQWHDEIGRALNRCDWFLLVLSPHSVQSKWVKRELLFALQEDRYTDRIAPIVRKACDYSNLSWTLASFQMIDFVRDFPAGLSALLRTSGLQERADRHTGHPRRFSQ
jgi:hypothetical protein